MPRGTARERTGGMAGGGGEQGAATLPPVLVFRPGTPSKHDFIGDP